MNVIEIIESLNADLSIDVIVKISGKKSLEFNFKGAKQLPFINDCVFLFLYIQSMQEGSNLIFPRDNPVSRKLLFNISRHQKIFSQWFKNELSEIKFDVVTKDNEKALSGAVSLFSGGIDSTYTFVEKQDELSHVFLCLGLDIQLEETEKLNLAVKHYTEFSQVNNKSLLVVSTNIRHVFPQGNRAVQHAALFTGLVSAYGLEKLYIPASHNIDELFPWGSHILTDPLLSNGVTEVIHQGAVARTKKTEVISENQRALDNIRICNSSEKFNCGECEKCIRTMFSLAVLDKTAMCLPPLADKMDILKEMKIFGNSQLSFWKDNYQLAVSHDKPELAAYANKIVRNYQWRKWIKEGLQLLLNKP